MGERYLRSVRLLAQCYQSFERLAGAKLRQRTGLTPPQFDIIATLGNTPGMTFRELGERTLITKGTLTGVVDRLVQRGLVRRVPSTADRRQVVVVLSEEGEQEFDRVFGPQIAFLKQAFVDYDDDGLCQLESELSTLLSRLEGLRATLGGEPSRRAG